MTCPFCKNELKETPYSTDLHCHNKDCVAHYLQFSDSFWRNLTSAVEESNKRAVEKYKQELAAKSEATRPGWTQHNDTWLWNQNTKVRIGTDHIKRRFTVQIPLGGEKTIRAFQFETPEEAMEFAEKALKLVEEMR